MTCVEPRRGKTDEKAACFFLKADPEPHLGGQLGPQECLKLISRGEPSVDFIAPRERSITVLMHSEWTGSPPFHPPRDLSRGQAAGSRRKKLLA